MARVADMSSVHCCHSDISRRRRTFLFRHFAVPSRNPLPPRPGGFFLFRTSFHSPAQSTQYLHPPYGYGVSSIEELQRPCSPRQHAPRRCSLRWQDGTCGGARTRFGFGLLVVSRCSWGTRTKMLCSSWPYLQYERRERFHEIAICNFI